MNRVAWRRRYGVLKVDLDTLFAARYLGGPVVSGYLQGRNFTVSEVSTCHMIFWIIFYFIFTYVKKGMAVYVFSLSWVSNVIDWENRVYHRCTSCPPTKLKNKVCLLNIQLDTPSNFPSQNPVFFFTAIRTSA